MSDSKGSTTREYVWWELSDAILNGIAIEVQKQALHNWRFVRSSAFSYPYLIRDNNRIKFMLINSGNYKTEIGLYYYQSRLDEFADMFFDIADPEMLEKVIKFVKECTNE